MTFRKIPRDAFYIYWLAVSCCVGGAIWAIRFLVG
jgi:hypothetical protein